MTGPNWRLLAAITAALIAALALRSPAAGQQIDRAKLAQVKSAFLLNFAKFVTWPKGTFADETTPIVFGVLGDEYLARALEATLKDKQVQDRDLKVRRLTFDSPSDREELKHVQVLYIADSERKRWSQIKSDIGKADVLVVGETEAFAADGGMVSFVVAEGRIVFHMNRSAIEQTNLQVSAKLYQLAPVVHTKKPS